MSTAYILIRQREEYPHEAVAAGARALGLRPMFGVDRAPRTDDVLITWTPWRGSLSQRLGEQHRAAGGRWIVMENGYVPHPHGAAGPKHYCVGLNGFNGRGDHRNAASPPDRWRSFGLEIMPWRERGEHVALFAQMGGHDLDVTMSLHWPDDVVDRLTALTQRTIVYRPKPERPRYFLRLHEQVTMPDFVGVPVEQFLENAWAAVVYNSKIAVEALRRGVPALYDGPNSIVGGLVPRGIENIEDPPRPEREQFFYDLAYAQWSAEEIATGAPFKRMLA